MIDSCVDCLDIKIYEFSGISSGLCGDFQMRGVSAIKKVDRRWNKGRNI